MMLEFLAISIVAFLINGGYSQTVPKECLPFSMTNHEGYTILANQPGRSSGSATDMSKPIICDWGLTERWYRVQPYQGSDYTANMAWNEPASINMCQTRHPSYIKATSDPYPKNLFELVSNLTICTKTSGRSCLKDDDFVIKIRNCGMFNVYWLMPHTVGLDSDCGAAYCFDEKKPCKAGFFSSTGYEPCTDKVSVFTGVPKVSYSVEPSTNKLHFLCDVSALVDIAKVQVIQRVKWFATRVDDITGTPVLVHTQEALVTKTPFKLEEAVWKAKVSLGIQLICQVTGLNQAKQEGQPVRSEPFFAGLKVDLKDGLLAVKANGGNYPVTIVPTVPILCPPNLPPAKCKLQVRVYTRDVTSPQCAGNVQSTKPNILIHRDATETQCGFHIIGSFSHLTKPESQKGTIDIVGKMTNVYKGDSITTLYLAVSGEERVDHSGFIFDTPFFHWSQKLPDVKVLVSNENEKLALKICSSTNDPHMRTFEGRAYNMHEPGTFILYKHERLPIQVQATYAYCGSKSKATCNCGIAVQSGQDVFVYDACAKLLYERKIQSLRVGLVGCDDKAMVVEQRPDKSYKITLPTGTVVTMSPPTTSINQLTVTPSAEDWGANTIGGLCGVLYNRPGLEMKMNGGVITEDPNKFARSWMVSQRDNLVQNNAAAQSRRYELPPQCNCPAPLGGTTVHSKAECQLGYPGTRCSVENENGLLKICTHTNGKRRKRSELMEISDENIFAEQFKYPTEVPTEEIDYSWKNGWTEDQAKSYCYDLLTSHIPSQCSEIVNASRLFLLNSCISDIQMLGTSEYALGDLKALVHACRTEIMVNNDLWVSTTSADGEILTEGPPQNLLDELCPGACSLKGSCDKGVCQCNAGFTGDDCGISLDTKPSELFIPGNGLCDLNDRLCEASIIYGQNFTQDIGNPTCRLREFVYKSADLETKVFTQNLTTPAVIMSQGQAKCELGTSADRKRRDAGLQHPNHAVFGYALSMSNNGKDFSPEEVIIVYDSDCFSFDHVTRKGIIKKMVCVIDGDCYMSGIQNPAQTEQSCIPAISQTAWSVTGSPIGY